jgi:hypothetical protein
MLSQVCNCALLAVAETARFSARACALRAFGRANREKRLARLAQARAKIEARSKDRYEREKAEHEAKLAAREAKANASGKKPGGKPPRSI